MNNHLGDVNSFDTVIGGEYPILEYRKIDKIIREEFGDSVGNLVPQEQKIGVVSGEHNELTTDINRDKRLLFLNKKQSMLLLTGNDEKEECLQPIPPFE